MGKFHMDRFKILPHALKTEVCFMIPQGWMTFMAWTSADFSRVFCNLLNGLCEGAQGLSVCALLRMLGCEN